MGPPTPRARPRRRAAKGSATRRAKEPLWTDGGDGGIEAAPHAAAGCRSEAGIGVAPEAVSPPADEASASERERARLRAAQVGLGHAWIGV